MPPPRSTFPVACLLLAACGGGGGGGGSAATSPTTISSNNAFSAVPAIVGGISAACSASGGGAAVSVGEGQSGSQWHLLPAAANVTPVWSSGLAGDGVVVSVVDDGVQLAHEDLAANMVAGRSRNIHNNGLASNDPSPTSSSNGHGTSVAGLIAAAANGKGVLGMAPRAGMLGVNLLAGGSSLLQESASMLYGNDIAAVVNNSWGNTDGTGELTPASGTLWYDTVQSGAEQARCGRGMVYLFAAGNGAAHGERSNYDYLNGHPMVLNVGAVSNGNIPASYSEPGANILLSAPGSSLTTTAYSNSYRSDFSGTSGASPVLAGVVALMLQARPTLSWRDVRWILARSARPVASADDSERVASDLAGSGGVYSHKVGFGVVDAAAAVTLAQSFSLLPAAKRCSASRAALTLPVPDNNSSGVSDSTTTSGGTCPTTIEALEVSVSVPDHPNFGELDVLLTSPAGRVSNLALAHDCYLSSSSSTPKASCSVTLNNFRFGVIRHLGESLGSGGWTLTVKDRKTGTTGTLTAWSITVWGH